MKYYLKSYGDSTEDARDFPRTNKQYVYDDPEDYAVDAAEYYWHNEDGWESKWPIVFTIVTHNAEVDVKVDMEALPSFFT